MVNNIFSVLECTKARTCGKYMEFFVSEGLRF